VEVEKRLGKVGTVFTPGVFTDLEPACISRQAERPSGFSSPTRESAKTASGEVRGEKRMDPTPGTEGGSGRRWLTLLARKSASKIEASR
jgi:hypothetical protein